MRQFPTFKTHDEANCFYCHADFDGEHVSETGYPSGRFSQPCRKCGHRTYYDLDPFKPGGGGSGRVPLAACIALAAIPALLVALLLMLAPAAARAEETLPDGTITLRQGYVSSWRSTNVFSSIVMGKADVVDVIPQSDNLLLITAKAPGSTNMLLFNEKNEQVGHVDIVVIGRDSTRVQVYSKLGNLHGYWAYDCSEHHCNRTDDPLAGSDRVPVYPPVIVMPPPLPVKP